MTLVKNTKRPRYPTTLKSGLRRNIDSTDNEYPIWIFTHIDRDGPFAFDINRPDFRHKDILDKIINYSSMTWAEIKRQTHDGGRSKHHGLDSDRLSDEARKRISKLHEMSGGIYDLDLDDGLFSFAFTNKLRILGIREGVMFYVLWYDPEHKVYPVKK